MFAEVLSALGTAVHLVPAPAMDRRVYLLHQSISWLCFVKMLLILLSGSLQECTFPSLMVVQSCIYTWSPWCLAYIAQLRHQSWIALNGECTSVHFACLELDFQQMVLSKQETGCSGVETCCMVASLERHFGFCARTLLSF